MNKTIPKKDSNIISIRFYYLIVFYFSQDYDLTFIY